MLQPGEGGYSEKLVAAYDPFSAKVETLRALRSELILRWFSNGHKSLAIFSVDADDGVSLLAEIGSRSATLTVGRSA